MKKILLMTVVATVAAACTQLQKERTSVIDKGLTFCESVLEKDGTLYVTNFGTSVLDPLNNSGQGYVVAIGADSVPVVITPADGNLSAPKGTIIKDNYLIVADVNKLVIYNIAGATLPEPKVIRFPAEDLFVNDMAFDDDILYVTVTNSGNIYSLDINNIQAADSLNTGLTLYTNIPGANGIVINDGTMYVASYPPDGNTTPNNVIYVLPTISNPQPQQLIDRPGQYDGLALSDDESRLYFTDWVGGRVGYVDLATKAVSLLDLPVSLMGPARICIEDGYLYIPDLPTSRVIKYQL